MALIDVYDGAFLHPLSAVPANVRAIVGYVGGSDAFHVWSVADTQEVRASGREFWSLWVPPQRALSAADGTTAANGMIRALLAYRNPTSRPVFLNIEYDTYAASPNAVDLSGPDFDGGRAGVADFSMFSAAFDGPVAGAVAFDHAGVGSVSTFAEWVSENFVDHALEGVVIRVVRGEIPRSRRLRGESRAGIG